MGLAIAMVLAVVAMPVLSNRRRAAHKAAAMTKMRVLGGAIGTYVTQSNGLLPIEDAGGDDTWNRIAKSDTSDVWYNALPRAAGKKPASDYSSNPASFYTEESALFVPGARYPDKKKLHNPMFAIAFNTKLEHAGPNGEKERTKMSDITKPELTVALLEQGLPNENRSSPLQSKNDYDGKPKGSAKSFIGRYDGQGVICFLDGHAELLKVEDLLTPHGTFPFPQTKVVWTRTPEENPNKDHAGKDHSEKKKKK